MLKIALSIVLLATPIVRAATETEGIAKIPHFDVVPSTMDVAVVIGIEKYRDVGPSAHSAKDAKLFYDYLLAMGYAPRNVKLLLNDRATNGDLQMALERFLPNHAKPGGRVVVYYSGHGAPEPASGEAYLVPYNGDPAYLADTAYPIKKLHEKLAKLTDSRVMLIVDACFSGTGGRSVIAPGARPLVSLISPVLRRGDNVSIMTASQDSQISTSSPELGHGLFTYHLIEALRAGKGAFNDIFEYVRPKVEDDAMRMNVKQSPTLSKAEGTFMIADISGVVFEKPKAPEVSPEALAELELEKKKIAEEKIRLEAEAKRISAEADRKVAELKKEHQRKERELKEKADRDRKRIEKERKAREKEFRRKERALKKKQKRRKRSYRAPPPP